MATDEVEDAGNCFPATTDGVLNDTSSAPAGHLLLKEKAFRAADSRPYIGYLSAIILLPQLLCVKVDIFIKGG